MRPSDPRVRAQLAPARRPLVGVLVAGVLGAALVVAQAFALTGLVLAALDGHRVVAWALVVAGVLAARAVSGWLMDVSAANAAAIVATDLRRRLMGAVLREGADVGTTRSSGELAVLATRGVAAAEPYLTRYVPALVLAGVLPAITVIAIATQDLLTAVIVMATLPLVPVFGALVGLATRDRAESQWRAMASLSGHFLDVMRGLPTLVAFRRAEAQSTTIRQITHRYRRATLQTLRVAFASSAVLELVATLSVALVAVTVGLRLAAGNLDLRTALVVLLLAPEAYWPLRRVGAEFHAAAEGAATLEQMSELTAPTGSELRAERAERATEVAVGAIELAGLGVVYPGRTTPALVDVSAVISSRGITVLTGQSGCGKSTLLAVLAGLVEPTSGVVHVAGRPVEGDAWRSQVAWLPQRPVFVAGSVADNLRLGRPDVADDELWAVLRQVALEERVRSLPGGLDAPLGEDGRTLSAGERARLALARVVVSQRPWVFLDEPTAHVDDLTEQILLDTIAELGRTCGVVVVAHRPAMVDLADHVIALPAATVAPSRPPLTTSPATPLATSLTTPLVVDTTPTRAPGPTSTPEPPDSSTAGSTAGSLRRALTLSTVIGALAAASGVALTATAGWLIVQASQHPPVLTLMVAIVGVRTFGLARPVLQYVERLRSHDAALSLLAERRVEVYDAVVPLTPGRLGKRRGDVLASIVDDVDAVVDRELRVRMPLWTFGGVAAVAVALATWLLPVAGAALATTCVLTGAIGYLLARAAAGRAERRAVEARATLSEQVVETAQIAPELLMWQAGAAATEAVVRTSRRLTRAGVRAATGVATARAAVLLVTGAGIGAVALLASPAVSEGSLSGPMLALLVLLPLALAEVALPLVDAGGLSARTQAAESRLDALASLPPAVTDPQAPAERGASVVVEATHMDAGWGKTPALRDLSLRIGEGERIGVIGPSGSGKSTLAALLLRFIDPQSGQVSLGGVPLTRLALDDVRREVGLVDDDPHVFATTIVENVRLARPDATDQEVRAALLQARLGPWLDALPEGLDTWLGDGHAQLSGGERARLAMARSLLADQPVLVLDEPTAHLDHATATELAHEVLGSSTGRSVVWITHGTVGLDLVDGVVDLADRSGLRQQVAGRSVAPRV